MEVSYNATVRSPPAMKSPHPPPRLTNLPDQWLQCQTNGSNVCRVLRFAGVHPSSRQIWVAATCTSTGEKRLVVSGLKPKPVPSYAAPLPQLPHPPHSCLWGLATRCASLSVSIFLSRSLSLPFTFSLSFSFSLFLPSTLSHTICMQRCKAHLREARGRRRCCAGGGVCACVCGCGCGCGISHYSGRDCVKSPRSSYMGLYPQSGCGVGGSYSDAVSAVELREG